MCGPTKQNSTMNTTKARPASASLFSAKTSQAAAEHAAGGAGELESELGVGGRNGLRLHCHQYLTLGSSTA